MYWPNFGGLLIYYIMISGVGKSWPMNIGGKPNFTFYQNMPAFVPIMFECTVLFASHLMSLTNINTKYRTLNAINH